MTKRKISATKNKIKISYEIRNIKFCPEKVELAYVSQKRDPFIK